MEIQILELIEGARAARGLERGEAPENEARLSKLNGLLEQLHEMRRKNHAEGI